MKNDKTMMAFWTDNDPATPEGRSELDAEAKLKGCRVADICAAGKAFINGQWRTTITVEPLPEAYAPGPSPSPAAPSITLKELAEQNRLFKGGVPGGPYEGILQFRERLMPSDGWRDLMVHDIKHPAFHLFEYRLKPEPAPAPEPVYPDLSLGNWVRYECFKAKTTVMVVLKSLNNGPTVYRLGGSTDDASASKLRDIGAEYSRDHGFTWHKI